MKTFPCRSFLCLGLLVLCLVLPVRAGYQTLLFNPTNGVVLVPTNLFSANIAPLTNALNAAGYAPGSGGSGTNAVLWTTSGSVIYPSGSTGTAAGWVAIGNNIFPQ